MKRNVLFAVAFFATLVAGAQNIAAVSPSNVTTMYQTLDEAVSEAENGSIIYLPGGGFQISDETKITNKLTIMGVSHRGDADNADGATMIAGNLNFEGGSSGSAVIGVYVSGDINVGNETDEVTNLTVRFCNVNSIQVKNSQSSGMIINQCYLRNNSNFGGCNATVENNILHSIQNLNGGVLNHNVVTSFITWSEWRYTYSSSVNGVSNSTISNNFFLDYYDHGLGTCVILNNCKGNSTLGEECEVLDDGITWEDVFKDHKGVSINSNYKLIGKWGKGKATDGSDIGIYGGSGFKEEKSLAPIPRIVSKKVDERTDGSGMLHIEVTVKAE